MPDIFETEKNPHSLNTVIDGCFVTVYLEYIIRAKVTQIKNNLQNSDFDSAKELRAVKIAFEILGYKSDKSINILSDFDPDKIFENVDDELQQKIDEHLND